VINRRDFLKLSSALLLSQAVSPLFVGDSPGQSNKKNILIIVFDALSAKDMSIYGYLRDTMPNLSRILERATVFHNHYSNANFTSPGVASLLTGTLPWTHRAIQAFSTVREELVTKNIFNLVRQNGYHTIAYSHNPLVERLLVDFIDDIDNHIPREKLYLFEDIHNRIFIHDYDIAELSRHQVFSDDDIYKSTSRYTQSIFLKNIYWKIITNLKKKNAEPLKPYFPYGLPNIWKTDHFTLEDGINFIIDGFDEFPTPFLGYFHFFPPHYPYHPRIEFSKLFRGDGYQMPEKPDHLFSTHYSYKQELRSRQFYDEFIAYVDAEFTRLYNFMDERGLLENTLLVFTSDHGEMFERGIIGHLTECLYEPVIRTPLIIFEPGQNTRQDIFSPSSSIDVLPTILQLTDQHIPDWVEGKVLPPYTHQEELTDPRIFTIQARHNGKLDPLTKASIMMVKEQYKLHAYFGYEQLPPGEILYELYDLKNDPEELENLVSIKTKLAKDLIDELQVELQKANQPFID